MFSQILALTGNLINESIVPEPVSNVFSGLFGVIATLGGIILLYLLFAIINFILERKKYKKITEIDKHLNKIEKILDGKNIENKS